MADDAAAAHTFKLQGNQALKAGEYAEAETYYSKAIDADATVAAYWYNRSVARLRQRKWGESLSDADKAMSLDSQYVKAYTTKGAALNGLGRYEEEQAAYEAGLVVDPSSATLKSNLESVKRKIAGGAASAGASGGGSGTAATTPKTPMLQQVQFFLSAFQLMNSVLYVLPLGAFSYGCFTRACMAAMANFGIWAFTNAGRPKFSKEYAALLMMNSAIHYFFMAMLFLTARPTMLHLVPLLLGEVLTVTPPGDMNGAREQHSAMTHFAAGIVRSYPRVATIVTPYINKALPSISGRADFMSLSSGDKWRITNNQLLRYTAVTEVLIGISTIISIVTPARNFMMLLMFWQTLQIRFMTSQFSKDAFAMVHLRILGLVNHQYCPGMVRNGYMKLSGWLSGMAQPPQPGQQGGGVAGMLSKCTIM